MKFITFMKQALSSDSPVSSKRIAGFLGWIVCLLISIYCTILEIQAPTIIDTLFITSCALLGLDSIVNIFKKNKE